MSEQQRNGASESLERTPDNEETEAEGAGEGEAEQPQPSVHSIPEPAAEPASEEIPARQKERKDEEISLWTEVRSWFRDLLFAAAICLLLIIYVAQPFRVEKTSMEPLFHDGDRIIVNKLALMYEPIKRGDIVVLWNPRDPRESWIKRVIGLPGERVQIIDGVVNINGRPLPEPYIPDEERNPPKNAFPSRNAEWLTQNYPERMEEFGYILMEDWTGGPGNGVALRVPDGYYFVAGDHRRFSMDSRDSIFPEGSGGPGLIPEKYIYGKAFFRYWPLDDIGFVTHPDYEDFE